MHELTIADRLAERARAAAEDAGAERVTGLTVAVGEATHLAPDQLRFCLEAVADDRLADATVTFERKSARGRCDCGWTGELDRLPETVAAVPDRRCPSCGATVELTEGRGCRLVGVEVPEQTDTPDAPNDTPAE